MTAGGLKSRLRFERRGTSTGDDLGSPNAGPFAALFDVPGEVIVRRAGEEVIAGRLAGRVAVILRVRDNSRTRNLTNGDRAVDVKTGTVYNIRTNVESFEVKGYRDLDAEAGVAT